MMTNCTLPVFGPPAKTAFDMRGIRFLLPDQGEQGAGGGGGGGGGNENGDEKKFSQAELDRISGERLDRERKKYEGFDDLKAKAEKWDTFESARSKADGKDDDKGKDGEPTGLDDAAVQKRIDDALAAERLRGGSKLVGLELDRALAGRHVEPSKLLGFNRAEFVTAEGEVDQQKLTEWVTKNTTESLAPRARRDPSQGQRDASANGGSVQSGRELFEQRHSKKK